MVKIAVIGSGLLGIKIAGEFAYYGHRVKIFSNDMKSLNTVFERMEEDKGQLRSDGLLSTKNFIGTVLCMSRLEETVNDADFIFECVPDDLETKKDVFERISHVCKPGAIISTNTLTLNCNDIIERTETKERTLGLRFLFPVYYIPEVEVTPNKFTSGATIEKVRVLLEKMGKTLFFRSGNQPLILNEDQREERKRVRLEQIRNSAGIGTYLERVVPSLSQSHSGHGSGPPMPVRQFSRDPAINTEGETDCAICMDKSRDCVMRPCNHMVTCYDCADMLVSRRDGCPICRKEIIEVIRVYSG